MQSNHKEVRSGADDQFRRAVERMHRCKATLVLSVPVTETLAGGAVWEGVVHVFDLKGHAIANRAYAWAVERGNNRRIFALLHQPLVTSPSEAVRSVLAAEQGSAGSA